MAGNKSVEHKVDPDAMKKEVEALKAKGAPKVETKGAPKVETKADGK